MLDTYVNGIDWSLLPNTFQDAISITRVLGIRYLWFDSLCIKQDDLLDREIESSKMADIYSNCQVAIAATGTENCTVGCLLERWSITRGWRGRGSGKFQWQRSSFQHQQAYNRPCWSGQFPNTHMKIFVAGCQAVPLQRSLKGLGHFKNVFLPRVLSTSTMKSFYGNVDR
jgi:hypothetical protein